MDRALAAYIEAMARMAQTPDELDARVRNMAEWFDQLNRSLLTSSEQTSGHLQSTAEDIEHKLKRQFTDIITPRSQYCTGKKLQFPKWPPAYWLAWLGEYVIIGSPLQLAQLKNATVNRLHMLELTDKALLKYIAGKLAGALLQVDKGLAELGSGFYNIGNGDCYKLCKELGITYAELHNVLYDIFKNRDKTAETLLKPCLELSQESADQLEMLLRQKHE